MTSHNDKFFLTMGVPKPSIDREEALRQLMAFRNEWRLYRRKCDATGEEILSAYPEGVPFPVYKNEVWWGDSWDPLSYGRDFDFSRPFFEQLKDLQNVVPREGTSVFQSENCAYNGHIRESRNCYMNALVYRAEDSHYSYYIVNAKDVVDCLLVNNSTLAYECMSCDTIYNCAQLEECNNCENCFFSYQLRGCQNCIGCSNLQNKSYYAFNKPVSKEEFKVLQDRFLNGSYRSWLEGMEIFNKVYSESAHRALHNLHTENVVGDHVLHSRNCSYAFDGQNGEDVYNSISFFDSKDIHSCYSAGWPACTEVYLSAVTRGSTNIAFCYYTFFSSDLRYCDSSSSCHNCFGCIGLRRSRYCILNKEYSEEDYFSLEKKIIEHMKKTGEWGRYFPGTLSTFPFNDTAAADYFPLSKEDAVKREFRWTDEEELPRPTPGSKDYILPDSLDKTGDDVTTQILYCKESKKPYRIVKQEIDFYKKMNLPLPRECPQVRHRKRLKRRNPYEIFTRTCDSCKKEILSTYAPTRKEIVYCEEDYLKNIL